MSDRKTIFDIAEEAGVSIATVSRVMAGSEKVRPTTRDKVMDIIQKHNFKPSMIASGLSKRKSHTIGMVMPLIENPYYAKLCVAAQQEAQRSDISMQLYQMARGTMFTQAFVDLLIGKRMDGLILSGDIASESNNESVMDLMRQVKPYMPLVMIMPLWAHDECVCLTSDLSGGFRMAIRHLIRLGHERIAMVGGTGPTENPGTREYAYVDELTGRGLPVYPFTTGETPADGELCVLKLLSGLEGQERPTALVCFNDLVAMGALRQLKRMGIEVPEGMAVVGCDNLFFAGYTEPGLTTVDFGIEETARLAVRVLMDGDAVVFRKVFEPTLVVRDSCGANPAPLKTREASRESRGT